MTRQPGPHNSLSEVRRWIEGHKPLKRQYLYHITEQVSVTTKLLPYDFEWSNKWATVQNGKITLHGNRPDMTGYATDGCSPKFGILQLVIGTPDGIFVERGRPITFNGFWPHDLLYQFCADHGLPRKTVDLIFREQLRKAGFIWADVYYWAVRLFGWWSWDKNLRNNFKQWQDSLRHK